MAQQMLRLPAVIEQSGHKRASIYKHINSGLWTKPVRIGLRSVAWPSSEVNAIVAARVAGRTDGEIRALVTELEAARRDADVAAA